MLRKTKKNATHGYRLLGHELSTIRLRPINTQVLTEKNDNKQTKMGRWIWLQNQAHDTLAPHGLGSVKTRFQAGPKR